VADDELGQIVFYGDDAAANNTIGVIGAMISVEVVGTVSTGIVPASIGFHTTNAAGSRSRRVKFTAEGGVSVGAGAECGEGVILATTAMDAPEFRQNGGASGQLCAIKSLTEVVVIAAAAFTDSTIQIPAEALVIAVSVRANVQIPTAVTYDVGVAGATTRYGTAISDVAGTTAKGTLAGILYYAAATSIRITPNATPSSNTGRIRVTIHYIEVTPPSIA
jgi:hypothetical protein